MSQLNHVAIIPDGNRRWARAKGLPTFEGHRRGFESIKKNRKTSAYIGCADVDCLGIFYRKLEQRKAGGSVSDEYL